MEIEFTISHDEETEEDYLAHRRNAPDERPIDWPPAHYWRQRPGAPALTEAAHERVDDESW